MWDLIVSVPDHCLSFYFKIRYGSTVGFLLLQCSSGVVRHPRDHVSVESSSLFHHSIYL